MEQSSGTRRRAPRWIPLLILAACLGVLSHAHAQANPPPLEFAVPPEDAASTLSEDVTLWLIGESQRLEEILLFLVGVDALDEYLAWENDLVVGFSEASEVLARMQLRLITIHDLLAPTDDR